MTVVPSSSVSINVLPAGTVNGLIFTVVHLTALLTSFKDEIVPTQLLPLAAEAAVMREIRANKRNIVISMRKSHLISARETRQKI